MKRYTLPAMSVGLTVLLSSAPLSAQIDFDPATLLTTGQEPDQTVVGDFDDDGMPDLAVTSDNPDKIQIYLNDGQGGFAAPFSIFLGAGVSPSALAAGDWDFDGDDDLAVALKDSDTVQFLFNQGAAVFLSGGSVNVGERPVDLEVADLNGDGRPDLASANRDDNSATILLNDGTGNFTASTIAAGTEPRAVSAGDLDRDGDRDLAVAAHDSRSLQILVNNGSGVFSAGATLSLGAQLRPAGVVAADFDGDDDMDLAAGTSGNGLNFVSVFLQGAAGFGAPVHYASGGVNPSVVVAHDLDLDGDRDVATVHSDSATLSALPNLGAGTFGAAVSFATGGTASDHLVAGDLDGNGAMDLITTNRDSNNLSVFRNRNDGPWQNLGQGLAGGAGVPRLDGVGPLLPATTVRLEVEQGRANAPAVLIVGLGELNASFRGGTLVPTPDFFFYGFMTDARGDLAVEGEWPNGVPAGLETFHQFWIFDSAAVKGVSATNGLKGTSR